jgi:hypothetical protein
MPFPIDWGLDSMPPTKDGICIRRTSRNGRPDRTFLETGTERREAVPRPLNAAELVIGG